MKRYIQWLGGICLSLLALVSCSDDLGMQAGTSVREGIPTQVKLTFKAENRKNVEVTRAGKEGDNEVNDLYILIFNSTGNLKTWFYDSEGFTQKREYTIQTTSGESYILAVANVANGNAPAEYNTAALKTALDEAKDRTVESSNPFTLDELKDLQVSYRRANVGVIDRIQSTFMMSGKYVNTNGQDLGDGRCTIPENGALTGEIQLYRTDAEIIFNVSIGDDVKQPTSGATITPSFELTSYRVVNIPRRTYVMNNAEDWDGSDATTAPLETNYYTMSENNAQEDWNDMVDGSKQFTIYLMENRKSAKESATAMTGYNDRERQEKTPTGEEGKVTNGDWTYAPERGTYVVLRGIFRGYEYASYDEQGNPQGDLVPVEGREVQYKIHLGNFSNNQWSNFETKRNTSYTYNVKVNGVKNIVVEVLTDEENQPGATGDIFFTNNTNIYELDAHYETCLLRFTKSMLAGITGGNAPTYRVSTPFSISNEEDNPTYKSQDANWVRFAINARSGYNGSGNYNTDLRSYASNGGGCASDSPNGAKTTYSEGDLLTVDDLMAVLGELQNNPDDSRWDNNDQFLVTCFVNEFYYTNDTKELGYDADKDNGSQYAVPEGANVQADVPLWKYCVNQPDRTLHLLCDIHASADGESNIIDAAYVINQKSIQTFYNTDPSVTSLTSCMGLETVNETRSENGDVYLTMGTPVNNSRDYRDGLTNTLYMWGFLRNVEENEKGTWVGTNNGWSTYINYADNGYKDINDETYIGMNTRYRNAYIACMQRNRDVNRDGQITEDEIKWYMPAVNQLGAMYIGEGALSTESRLMPDNSTWEITHYYSSTYKSDEKASSAAYNSDDGYVITVWAEEGFSISDANSTEQWRQQNGNVLRNPVRYHYRCVRNVGNIERSREGQSYLSTTRRPQNYWTLNDHTVDFTYLNSNATRPTATSGELGVHNQFDGENRVYTKMEYAAEDAGKLSDRNVHGSSNISLCRTEHGQGWRVPNQRELMFLALNGANQAANVTGLITDFPSQYNVEYENQWGGTSYRLEYGGYYARTRFKWYTTTGRVNRSPFDGRVRYGFELIGGVRGSGNSGNLSLTTADVAGDGNYSDYWGTTQYIRCVRDVAE